MRSDCTRDDSTPCDCPSCEAAEDAFWREQEGDPDVPPDDYGIEVGDLDDVTPLPPAPMTLTVAGNQSAGDLTVMLDDRTVTVPVLAGSSHDDVARDVARALNAEPRSRAKRRR